MDHGGHFQQAWDWFVAVALGPFGAAVTGRFAWLTRSSAVESWRERWLRWLREMPVILGAIIVGVAIGDRYGLSVTQTSGLIFALSYLGPEGLRPLVASLWDWWKGRLPQ